jgi:hypothetical protein
MQKQDRPLGPHGPNALLLQEREEARKLREREEDKERHDDFHFGIRAINDGHSFFDHRGKRLRGFGKNPLLYASLSAADRRSISEDMNLAAALGWGALVSNLQRATIAMSQVFGAFSAMTVAAPVIKPRYEDENYTYDEMKVSVAVSNQLAKEMAKVAGISAQMAALDINVDPFAPWKENDLWDQRKGLMDEFGMRALPHSYDVAHSYERVMELESVFNPYAIAQHATVLVYRPKIAAQDSLGVKVKVGDPNNTDPAEAIASGDHLKGGVQAQPILPPEFHHS